MPIKNLADVRAYLDALPKEATEKQRWQALRTVTRRLMREHGMTDATKWTIEPLPHQATWRYGDCASWLRRIRYRGEHVTNWWTETLAETVVHEAAHALTSHALKQQGRLDNVVHGPMWKATAAAMGLKEARATSLPVPQTPEQIASAERAAQWQREAQAELDRREAAYRIAARDS